MKVIDSVTGTQINLRNTKQFLDDVVYATKWAKVPVKDMKKFMTWYCGIYARLHIKRRDGVNHNEGCNLAKLVKFLSKKMPSGEYGSNLMHDMTFLCEEGFLSNMVYNDYFKILLNADMQYLSNGIKVLDWSTLNIKRNKEAIATVLTTLEQDKLLATFAVEPWLHCTKQTNWLLFEMLQDKLNKLCELETGLKVREVWIRRKTATGGSYQITMVDKAHEDISKPLAAEPIHKAFGGHEIKQHEGFADLN